LRITLLPSTYGANQWISPALAPGAVLTGVHDEDDGGVRGEDD
jgi:hypothetical protein